MKKIIILLFIICYVLIANMAKPVAFIKKIDLNLKPKDLAITFLKDDKSRALLIQNLERVILLEIDLLNNELFLEESLKLYGVSKIDYYFQNKSADFNNINFKNIYNIKNYKRKKFNITDMLSINIVDENLIIITYNKIKLIIINNFERLNMLGYTPEFVYLTESDFKEYPKQEIYSNIIYFFYDNVSKNDNLLEFLYSKWVESYEIKDKVYPTIKLSEKGFGIITIPDVIET